MKWNLLDKLSDYREIWWKVDGYWEGVHPHSVPSSHENCQIPERDLRLSSHCHARVGGGVWEGGEARGRGRLRPTRSRCRRNVRHEHRYLPHSSQEEAATDSEYNTYLALLHSGRQPVHVFLFLRK